jgi:hypothetical protein
MFRFAIARRAELMTAACALALAAACCAAQEPTYTVSGTVMNSMTHQPIARALVECREYAVLTDGEGRFEFNLPAGYAQIRVRRPGFGDRRDDWRSVLVGPDLPALALYLTPSATITGHVTLANGEPAESIRFTAFRKRAIDGHAQWFPEGRAETNSEGVFHFLDLQSHSAYVLCSSPSRETSSLPPAGAPMFGYPAVCYPGSGDFAAATPMTIAPGQHADVDIALPRQRFYTVSIAVPNSQGRGAGFQVHERNGQPVGFSPRRNEERGTWEVDLPNGNYYAEARSFGETPAYGRVDFRVADGPVQGLTLVQTAQHAVAVEIRKELTANNNTQGMVIGKLDDNGPGLNLNLIPADPVVLGGGGGLHRREGSTDSGEYEINVNTPGRYWVQVMGFDSYVSSITSGGVDLAREPLVVGAGGASPPIEIVLRNDVGHIDCVLNAPATADAVSPGGAGTAAPVYVYAIPQFPTVGRIPQTVISLATESTLPNVAPGTYRVVAFDHSQEIDFSDPQAMARLTANGQTVKVEAGGMTRVQLDVPGSASGEASQ